MEFREVGDQFFVAAQMTEADLESAREMGIRSIICNRPDREGADQPTFKDLSRTAEKLGLEMRYVPIVGGQVADTDVADFAAALEALPKPILAYCRSGARSATMWSLANANEVSVTGA